MDSVYFLIPISLLLLAVAVGVFIWSLRSGQFEDLEGPAHRVIIDDREEQARQEQPGTADRHQGDDTQDPRP